MELECSVPLNVGVSFAPTPSAPPRLGEASDRMAPSVLLMQATAPS